LTPVAMPFVTTEYKVTIISPEGCRAEARTIIRVDRQIDIYPPNIIWPEDPEGVNNAFTLYTRKGSVNRIVSLQIYDRWGEQMFVNRNFLPDDPSIGWDGTFKGEPMNPGVFVWWAEVELVDGKTILLKGDVTVVR
jgi:gliding motility-associated-like protein